MSLKPLFHKHVNEVVGSGRNERVRLLKDEAITANDFRILRMVRNDRGVPRGPRAIVKAPKPKTSTGGKVGRPPLYNGMDRIIMRGALKQHGLTGAQKYLSKERQMDVSLTVLRSVAKQFNLSFKRGRPAA